MMSRLHKSHLLYSHLHPRCSLRRNDKLLKQTFVKKVKLLPFFSFFLGRGTFVVLGYSPKPEPEPRFFSFFFLSEGYNLGS
jgi:hypothetical protein